jgi:hypothetical protein
MEQMRDLLESLSLAEASRALRWVNDMHRAREHQAWADHNEANAPMSLGEPSPPTEFERPSPGLFTGGNP